MMPIEELRERLEETFQDDQVHLTSPMDDNNHFQCVIVSEKFEGMTMVERHQMVYRALGEAMDEAVHALALKTYTPAQWGPQGARG